MNGREAGGPRRRSTRQSAALDAALTSSGRFLTAQELHERLRESGHPIGLATVYRQLKRRVEDGAVDVVIRPDGESAYRRCGPAAGNETEQHHHHLVCRECGHTVEVSGDEVEEWAARVARAAGFRDVSHTVEIFGNCGRHRGSGSHRGPSTR